MMDLQTLETSIGRSNPDIEDLCVQVAAAKDDECVMSSLLLSTEAPPECKNDESEPLASMACTAECSSILCELAHTCGNLTESPFPDVSTTRFLSIVGDVMQA